MDVLRQELADQRRIVEHLVGLIDSKFGEADRRIQQMQKALDESLSMFRAEINDLVSATERFKTYISAAMIVVENSSVSVERFDDAINSIDEEVGKLSRLLGHLATDIREGLSKVDRDCRKQILLVRSEILDRPSEAKEVKQELLKAIDVHKINSEGITTEIESCKHNAFITKKHVEDLYTQIDRIKKQMR